MKKLFSYLLRALMIIAAVFILVWVFFFAYLTINKNKIIAKIKTQLNQQVRGQISIGDLKPDFIHAFPFPAIKISNVIIRDSLWSQHHHDFINAPIIYARLKPLSLFDQKPSLGKINIENGTIYFYKDSSGHSNIVKTDSVNSGNKKNEIPNIQLTNTRLIFQDDNKHKLHDIFCEKLKCEFEKSETVTHVKIKIKSLVHSLSFNTVKGSYLHEKILDGKFELTLRDKNSMEFKNVKLSIDKQVFSFTGKFHFDQETFELGIETKKIRYTDALTFLPDTMKQKLKIYDINVPLSINAQLSGSLKPGSMPLTLIKLETKKAKVTTPSASFDNCSFAASFNNQIDQTAEPSDVNSQIVFRNFSGDWEKISLKSDSVRITDLVHPTLLCDVTSIFKLTELNELSGSNTLQFLNGQGDMHIRYKGSLIDDSTSPSINGNIVIKNSELSYLPRHFSLKNCNGTVEFRNQDVFIKKLTASAGGNQLVMNGSVVNLLTLLNTPERLNISWNIFSDDLDINNFISYVGKPAPAASNSRKKFFRIADKIDRMLKNGTADLHIQANKIRYKKFTAKNVSASVALLQNRIMLNEVKMFHAGGTIVVNGSLGDQSYANLLNFTATLDHVNIPEVFSSFSNFGQDAITDKNMKGILSANVIMSGLLTDQATIVQHSMTGKVDFSIENGELINFEPVQKISETAFKKRDFSDLRFAELKNNIEIDGSAIKIPNMEIHSNVLTMFVQGVYDVQKGTDMSIRVPVSNLKKPEPDVVLTNKNKAGLSIRLRAKTGDDGKLKVSWDPFNKSGKANQDVKTASAQQ